LQQLQRKQPRIAVALLAVDGGLLGKYTVSNAN
jgi:hypothetical protein